MRAHSLLVTSLLVAGSHVQPAFAYSSYMSRFAVRSQTEQGCMNAVGDVVRNKGVKVAWKTEHAVEGMSGNSVVTLHASGVAAAQPHSVSFSSRMKLQRRRRPWGRISTMPLLRW